MQYNALLEPSSEANVKASEEPGIEVASPPVGPLRVMQLDLPTAVYNKETDEVNIEIRPFHFPYRAQVRSNPSQRIMGCTHIALYHTGGLYGGATP